MTPANDPTSVYRYYDRDGALLYVGVTSRGIARNIEHNTSKEWFRFVARQEVEHHPTRSKALAREKDLIQRYHPPFNRDHNPGHALARDAYLTLASVPRPIRADRLMSRRQPNRPPKAMWFTPVSSDEDGRLVLALQPTASPMPQGWRLAPVSRMRIRDDDGREVGRITRASQVGDRAFIQARFTDPSTITGVALSIKWPPTELCTCHVFKADASCRMGSVD